MNGEGSLRDLIEDAPLYDPDLLAPSESFGSGPEPEPDPFPFPALDQHLASAVRFLIDGNQEDVASLLLACEMTIEFGGEWKDYGQVIQKDVSITLHGPRAIYDAFANDTHPHHLAAQRALQAVLPPPWKLIELRAHAELVPIDSLTPGWRQELLEIARGRGVNNQGVPYGTGPVRTWLNLRFRSQSELRPAQALDRAGVLFLPNCSARVTGPTGLQRLTREPDFLVCRNGKWGIIEVDGGPFHPATRAVQDHSRDRLFLRYGIRVVQHYDADACFNTPDTVVSSFLEILDTNG